MSICRDFEMTRFRDIEFKIDDKDTTKNVLSKGRIKKRTSCDVTFWICILIACQAR